MGELLDEFDFLIEEEEETTFLEDSEQLIREVISFKEKSLKYPKTTYQGIKVDKLCECIDYGETEIAPWEHTYFYLDLEVLRDINNEKLKELSIPTFIEEISSPDIKNGMLTVLNNIRHVAIPSNLLIIAPCTFAFYSKLENIKFAEDSKLIYLGEKAFAYCEKLHTVDLRKCVNLDKLPSNLFTYSSVEVLKISSNIKEITEDTFNNCNLKKIYIDKEIFTFDEFISNLKDNGYNPFW